MQRSITYKSIVSDFLWVAVFATYIALSSIYLFLPPMLAVLGYLYYRALQRSDLFSLVIASIMLLMFEAEKGYWFGSTLVFFTLISHYVMPKLEQTIQCKICIKGIFVLSSYFGFTLFLGMVNSVLLISLPTLDWHVLFYMAIEFSLIAIV
jgi:membrane-associated HD superfamily phosphohydrolase